MSEPIVVYYTRRCISCMNKVVIPLTQPPLIYEAPCPYCKNTIRIWP